MGPVRDEVALRRLEDRLSGRLNGATNAFASWALHPMLRHGYSGGQSSTGRDIRLRQNPALT